MRRTCLDCCSEEFEGHNVGDLGQHYVDEPQLLAEFGLVGLYSSVDTCNGSPRGRQCSFFEPGHNSNSGRLLFADTCQTSPEIDPMSSSASRTGRSHTGCGFN